MSEPKPVYSPRVDALHALLRHFTPQQLDELAERLDEIKARTGHGELVVTMQAGHVRFARMLICFELPKP